MNVILLPHFTRSLLLRVFLIWLVLRTWVEVGSRAMAAMLHMPPPQFFLLTPRAALALVGFVAAIGWISAKRRNEDLFLLCLGYSRAHLLLMLSMPAALIELCVGILVRR